MANVKTQGDKKAWESCHYCTLQTFKTPQDFERHLRERHCSQEGGSFVCRYGYNGVCASLPLDGVSDRDYESHVRRLHAQPAATRTAPWSVYSAAQNLPAALNDPQRGKRQTFLTDLWGDGFTERAPVPPCPHLPDVTHAHFELYVRKIGRKYRRHGRLAAQVRDAAPRPMLGPAGYETDIVPAVFFRPDLPLDQPETFNTVFPGLGEAHPDSRTPCRSLQEKLSHYLDVVEVQIAEQVARKSDAFFRAMLSHDTIVEQMSSAVRLVRSLRESMAASKAGLATEPAHLVRLAAYRSNASKVHDILRLMSTVHQTQPTIQLLLSTADYVTALDLIGSTQAVLGSELSGVHAFRHLSSQLTEMERLIDKMLSTEFQRFVTADLNRPPGDEAELSDRDKLISVISGLLRRKRFEFIDTYKEETITTVQALVKQALIEEVAGHEGEVWVRGTGESGGWRGAGAAALLTRAVPRLHCVLQRVMALRQLVLRATQAGDVALLDGEDFFTAEDQTAVEDKLRNLVDSICDYCMERCASLITAGDKDKSADGEQINRLSPIVEDFTTECERISGRRCVILKNALKNQASRYVQRFHNERRNKLTLLLDNERWRQAQVPAEFQIIVDNICETGFFPDTDVVDGESERPAASYLIVDKEPYTVAGVALLALRTVGEYCSAGRTGGASAAAGRALAELLRLFNSRSCQLVLGAGALQSAGLKTITAANLALASRALQLLLWCLPAARRHFCETDSDGLLTLALDGVERDLRGHVREIESKLSDIAGGLLSAQLNGWEARPPVPSQQFRSISRHLLKLHEALAGVLPATQLCTVYQTVHRNFKDKLREQLARMNIVGNGGPQHGVVTSELTFYLQTLVTLQVLPEEELSLKFMDEIWLKL